MALAGRRSYTEVEGLKVLASFPPEFAFAGSRRDAVARIGNSVPPAFMAAVAAHLRGQVSRVA